MSYPPIGKKDNALDQLRTDFAHISEMLEESEKEIERLKNGLCGFIAIDERLGESGDVFAKARAIAMRILLDGLNEIDEAGREEA